jgi:hypothetical protein
LVVSHSEGYVVLKGLLNELEVGYLRDSATKAWRDVKGKDVEFSGDKTW